MWYVLVDGVRTGDGAGFMFPGRARGEVADAVERLYERKGVAWPLYADAVNRVRGVRLSALDGFRVEFAGSVVEVTHRRNSDPGGYVVPGRGPGE